MKINIDVISQNFWYVSKAIIKMSFLLKFKKQKKLVKN